MGSGFYEVWNRIMKSLFIVLFLVGWIFKVSLNWISGGIVVLCGLMVVGMELYPVYKYMKLLWIAEKMQRDRYRQMELEIWQREL